MGIYVCIYVIYMYTFIYIYIYLQVKSSFGVAKITILAPSMPVLLPY